MSAVEEKKRILKAVLEKSSKQWMRDAASCVVNTYGPHDKFTGEDIRAKCAEREVVAPHANSWGALTSLLIKRGLIIETGNWVKMKSKRSHARRTPEYTIAHRSGN